MTALQSAEVICQWMPRLVAFETEFFSRHAYSEPTPANDCALETFIQDYGVLLDQFEEEIGNLAIARRVRAFASTLAEIHVSA